VSLGFGSLGQLPLATLPGAGAPPVAAGRLKYWNGSSWTAKTLKYWDGAAWTTKTLKFWNGSAWLS